MPQPLRVLFVEDLPTDQELAEWQLRAEGLQLVTLRVDSQPAFIQALKDFNPDVVISDYAMPEFDGMRALKLTQKLRPAVPFIMLTGSMNEDTAVECIKAGAADYVIKEHIHRLPFAVKEALSQQKTLREKEITEQRLRESEERFRSLYENANVGMYRTTPDGQILLANPSLVRMLGFETIEDLSQRNLEQESFELTGYSRSEFRQLIDAQEELRGHESAWRRKDGTTIHVRESAKAIRDEDGKVLYYEGTVEDVTERKLAEETLRESEARFSTVFHSSPTSIAITRLKDNQFIDVNAAWEQSTGFTREEAIGHTPFEQNSWLVPSDRERMLEVLKKQGQVKNFEFRMRRKSGDIVDLLFSAEFIEVAGEPCMLTTTLDITERKEDEERIHRSFQKLRETFKEAINALSSASEMRDPYTAGHQARVSRLAGAIAKEMGLAEVATEGVMIAGIVHDIGKLSIPAEILSKPSRLTEVEYMLIKTHSQIGYTILSKIDFPWPIAQIVYQHHERIDGSGYPQKLIGKDILVEARILAVADVVESMSSHRPYRPALGINKALEEISQNKGTLYDVDVVEACLKLFSENRFVFVDGSEQNDMDLF